MHLGGVGPGRKLNEEEGVLGLESSSLYSTVVSDSILLSPSSKEESVCWVCFVVVDEPQ